MLKAVFKCCLGWKCDAKYIRGAHAVNNMCKYIMFNITAEEDCGTMNVIRCDKED